METGFICQIPVEIAKRKQRGEKITQGTVAAAIGVSGGTMSMICRNKQLPEFETAYRLSEFFGVSINELWLRKELD